MQSLNSVSFFFFAVRWSEREKRASYLTNTVRPSLFKHLRLCDCLAYRFVACLDLRSVIFGEFRVWLSEVLQVDLEATVDISCAKYEHTGKTSGAVSHRGFRWLLSLSGFHDVSLSSCCFCADVLLCHDDELEGRRVAFILYLTPSWELKDGGTLDLFDTDGVCERRASFYPQMIEEHKWCHFFLRIVLFGVQSCFRSNRH